MVFSLTRTVAIGAILEDISDLDPSYTTFVPRYLKMWTFNLLAIDLDVSADAFRVIGHQFGLFCTDRHVLGHTAFNQTGLL